MTTNNLIKEIISKPSRKKRKKKKKNKLPKFIRHKDCAIPEREIMPISEQETEMCRSLWQSVIIQGLYDIAAGKSKLEHVQALAWFGQGSGKHYSTDFEMVCDLAGMDVKFIQRLARRAERDGAIILEGFNFRSLRGASSTRKWGR